MLSSEDAPLILVIDDHPEELQAVIRLLRSESLRVNVATDARQGLHRAQALIPDLILLDVRMPDIDGFAACRLLCESPTTRDVPVIFLSFAGTDEERLEGLLHGGVDYILKPCLPIEVLARVRIHLRLGPRALGPDDSVPETFLSPEEVILRAAMRLISADLAVLPSLAEIAHKVGTHDKKLSAIFRQHLGMTVFAWIREEKLRRSRELLASSLMSVQDVAEQVGFHSAANFATAFRVRMGVTPSRYRSHVQQTEVLEAPNAG